MSNYQLTAWQPDPPSPQSVELLRELRSTPAFGDPGNEFNLEGLRQGMGTRAEPADPRVVCSRVDVNGVPAEWVVAPGADPRVRLLYIHGGGYVSGTGDRYLPVGALLSAAAGCAVLMPDYRLAPEDPFPAGLEDCVQSFLWMRDHGPDGDSPASASFITGDSAGGGLTLATLLVLRDRGLPLPLGAMPLSACADMTMAGETLRTEPDPICSARAYPDFARLYLNGADPRNPHASPVFADYTGIPPLLLHVGEHEMLRDDSVRVARRAQADGVNVRLEIWAGQVHGFHGRGLPESTQAIERLADFMRACVEAR